MLGFICTSKAVGLLAKDLLLSDKAGVEYLLTFRISQNHLQSFFAGKVPSMSAQDNNPNAIQLKAALHRLLATQSVVVNIFKVFSLSSLYIII